VLLHLVSFRFKAEHKDRVGEAVERLNAMAPQIPEVLDLKVGTDVVHSARSYDLGLVVTLRDEAALAVYNEHPEHLPVKAFLGPLYESAVAVDFIVP
jgi:hypothetical protein